jgi:hypothetical protein
VELFRPRHESSQNPLAAMTEQLRQQIQRNLHFMNSLCRRMEKLEFPANDPLLEAAMKTRHAVQTLQKVLREKGRDWPLREQSHTTDSEMPALVTTYWRASQL